MRIRLIFQAQHVRFMEICIGKHQVGERAFEAGGQFWNKFRWRTWPFDAVNERKDFTLGEITDLKGWVIRMYQSSGLKVIRRYYPILIMILLFQADNQTVVIFIFIQRKSNAPFIRQTTLPNRK